MTDIMIKRDGANPPDARMKAYLRENRATITKLADHLTLGQYSESKKPKAEPKAAGLIIHCLGNAPVPDLCPQVRISVNGRVLIVDDNSGRQMHHIGDLRRRDGATIFVLATEANRYFAPVDLEISAPLQEIDGRELNEDESEERLVEEITTRLGLAASDP